MKLVNIDISKCDRTDKQVIEGICLNWDMVKGICLETGKECIASHIYIENQEDRIED